PNDPPNWIPGGRVRCARGIRQVVDAGHLAAFSVELGELAAAVQREIYNVVVGDRDAPRTGVRIRQLYRPDVLLPFDVEAADDAVAELAVPDLVPVVGHDQPIQRRASRALRRGRSRPDLGLAVARIEVADRRVADIREPDAPFPIGQQLVLVSEAEVMDAGAAAVLRA